MRAVCSLLKAVTVSNVPPCVKGNQSCTAEPIGKAARKINVVPLSVCYSVLYGILM